MAARATRRIGLSLNFHIGVNADSEPLLGRDQLWTRAGFSESTAVGFMANARTLAELLCSGVFHRFPDLTRAGPIWVLHGNAQRVYTIE